MSPEIVGAFVGGLIAMIAGLAGALLNHYLTLRRDRIIREEEKKKEEEKKREEIQKELRVKLTNGIGDFIKPPQKRKPIPQLTIARLEIRRAKIGTQIKQQEKIRKEG